MAWREFKKKKMKKSGKQYFSLEVYLAQTVQLKIHINIFQQ